MLIYTRRDVYVRSRTQRRAILSAMTCMWPGQWTVGYRAYCHAVVFRRVLSNYPVIIERLSAVSPFANCCSVGRSVVPSSSREADRGWGELNSHISNLEIPSLWLYRTLLNERSQSSHACLKHGQNWEVLFGPSLSTTQAIEADQTAHVCQPRVPYCWRSEQCMALQHGNSVDGAESCMHGRAAAFSIYRPPSTPYRPHILILTRPVLLVWHSQHYSKLV